MLGETFPTKYDDPRNLIVTIHIREIGILNTLVDLGVVINMMNRETFESLRITDLRPTPTILELGNRSKIWPEGILEVFVILMDS